MTLKEIQALGISRSTLSNWAKEENEKHALYKLLLNLPSSEAAALLKKQPTHRLSQLLNKNTADKYKFSYQEIVAAFKHSNYSELSVREKIIVERFFKECEYDDYKSLQVAYNIPRGNVKKLYISSQNLRSLTGVAKIWDRAFRLPHLQSGIKAKEV